MIDLSSASENEQALSRAYYSPVDHVSLQTQQQLLYRKDQVLELKRVTGMDQELAECLVDAGIQSSTLAALSLTPLVLVAWADGVVTEEEHRTVINSAMCQGIMDCPDAFLLLKHWLSKRPSADLWEAWQRYAIEFRHHVPSVVAEKFAEQTLARATRVAKASGGADCMGKISPTEQAILDDLAAVLAQ